MKREICRFIWWFSETFGIPLGRFAPIIFNGMMEEYENRRQDADET